MTDTEILNLIEHYRWSIKAIDDGWHIVLNQAGTYAFDKSLRKAIKIAIALQATWALSK